MSPLSRQETESLLRSTGEAKCRLFARAREARDSIWGNGVILRGVVELSNICRIDCDYCPMRRSNQKQLDQFILRPSQLLEACRAINASTLDIVFLQSGETPQATDLAARTIPAIKELFQGRVEIILGLGSMKSSQYERLRRAGADSYIIKHETSDSELHARLRGESLSDRLTCLKCLKELGFRVGTGTIVGLPGQRLSSIADDIALASELETDMCSASPFIPAARTPLSHCPTGDLATTLNAIAVMRLTNPRWLIPSVSALNMLHAEGQKMGLLAGANVVTANFTPAHMRSSYHIYSEARHIAKLRSLRSLLAELNLRPSGSCWLRTCEIAPHNVES